MHKVIFGKYESAHNLTEKLSRNRYRLHGVSIEEGQAIVFPDYEQESTRVVPSKAYDFVPEGDYCCLEREEGQ
jgi:hypothetical protein